MLTLKEINSLVVPRSRARDETGKMVWVQEIDGRALFKYRIKSSDLDTLERALADRLCSDWARIYILAPLAAGRFASRYNGGARSWDDCGKAVSNLYHADGARFRDLMAASLKHYKISIITSGGNELLLQTIISQAGLPSVMLERGTALRKLLDELIGLAVKGEDLDASSVRLVKENDEISQAYKEANHLPRLCADLVKAIDALKNDSGWTGGSLEAIWAMPGWERKLPFLVEAQRAQEIVGHLLNVAEKAAGAEILSIDRVLRRIGGSWRLRVRAIIPTDGVELRQSGLPDVIALHYAIDNVPVDEACRLRRDSAGISRFILARVGQDLSEELASPFRMISLCIPGTTAEIIECAGGEALDAELPWVFEVRPDGRITYRDSAPQRLRCRELLVASTLDTRVEGNAVRETGILEVPTRSTNNPQKRQVWRVSGRAEFQVANEAPLIIEANYQGPQVHLGFSGKVADIAVSGCSAVFIGDPRPRRIGGLTGHIQWRMVGTNEWQTGKIPPIGRVNCRLTDNGGTSIAERRIFVFPEDFRHKITEKCVELRLGSGFTVPGRCALDGHNWLINFGASTEITIPIDAPSGQVALVFHKPSQTAFKNIVTSEQYDHGLHRVTGRLVGALLARSYVHDRVLVRRKGGAFSDVREFLLQSNELRLSSIKPFLSALAFSFRGRTSTITVEFPNHVAIEIEAFRLRRNGDYVSIAGAGAAMTVELHELIPQDGQTAQCIPLEPRDQSSWTIPSLAEGSQYLAVDTSYQAAPCLVTGTGNYLLGESRTFAGCVALSNEEERRRGLADLFELITSNPCNAFRSAQFDICLDWFGRFKFILPWVDPFLVLASKPELALKVLVVAKIRGHIEAQLGLKWALDEVPLFWHGLTPGIRSEALDWARSQFGAQSEDALQDLMRDLGMSETYKHVSGRPELFFDLTRDGWHTAWQRCVLSWKDAAEGHFGARPLGVVASVSSLWGQIADNERLSSILFARCSQVPHSMVDLHDTYLLAPFDLALAVTFGVDLDPFVQDDLIYARYAIDPVQFDQSFCFAISLIELLK